MLLAGATAALGHYLQVVGHADDFATVASIAFLFTLSFWAHQRPDRLRARFGPFGKIADAIRESVDDIRQWIYQRPVRVGLTIAIAYGIMVVIMKSLIVMIISALYSWELAVIAGAIIGAIVVAPAMFATAYSTLTDERTQNINLNDSE
jgi:tetrahydromethanopterin S-methyltransferase subunit G